jgi:hypothetical protein
VLGRERDDEEDDEADSEAPERLDFAEMGVRDAEHVIGGAIFAADLDTSHPLGFGFANRELPVHRNESFTLMQPEDDPYAVPVQYTDDPLLTATRLSAARRRSPARRPSSPSAWAAAQ